MVHGDTVYGDTVYGDTVYGDTVHGDSQWGLNNTNNGYSKSILIITGYYCCSFYGHTATAWYGPAMVQHMLSLSVPLLLWPSHMPFSLLMNLLILSIITGSYWATPRQRFALRIWPGTIQVSRSR